MKSLKIYFTGLLAAFALFAASPSKAQVVSTAVEIKPCKCQMPFGVGDVFTIPFFNITIRIDGMWGGRNCPNNNNCAGKKCYRMVKYTRWDAAGNETKGKAKIRGKCVEREAVAVDEEVIDDGHVHVSGGGNTANTVATIPLSIIGLPASAQAGTLIPYTLTIPHGSDWVDRNVLDGSQNLAAEVFSYVYDGDTLPDTLNTSGLAPGNYIIQLNDGQQQVSYPLSIY